MRLTKQIIRSTTITPSPRLSQVLGMFDIPPTNQSELAWDVDITLPDKWNIGVIVGPSGCGKTTVARELFGDHFAGPFEWPAGRSILDGFPRGMSVQQIVSLLSCVGFSSPPAWVRPFDALSNGQQFRVNLARKLADSTVDGWMRVMDEYSSVVDRTVARIGSAAVAASVRRLGLQFVAVTCHYDVLDWLDPDWIYEPNTNQFRTITREASADARGLQRRRRPAIDLEIIRTDRSAWNLFKPHHYLSASLNPAAACYVGLVEGHPAAFTAVLPFPHPTAPGWREHRTVCLPDFQGVGIGNAMSEFIAGVYRSLGRPYTSTTSHPAMIHHRARSPLWKMIRKPGLSGGSGGRFSMMRKTAAIDRITAGFKFTGPARPDDARRFGLVPRSTSIVPRRTDETRCQPDHDAACPDGDAGADGDKRNPQRIGGDPQQRIGRFGPTTR